MSTKKSLSGMTAVAFAAALTLSSAAQAGTLHSRTVEGPRIERSAGMLSQAASWLSGVLTELKVVFALDSVPNQPPSTCGGNPCPTTDSGWTIDPEGHT
jgi:hypothetical protein